MANLTQANRILMLLRDRGPRGASNFELMQISYQYPARIHTLRHKEGHVIETKHINDKEWRITLIKEAGRPAPIAATPAPKPQPVAQPQQATLLDVPPKDNRRYF